MLRQSPAAAIFRTGSFARAALVRRQRTLRAGRIPREITLDACEDSARQAVLVRIVVQALLLFGIRDERGLDENRWNVRRLEDCKACLLDAALVQGVHLLQLAEHGVAEPQAVIDRRGLRQIE